MAVPLSIIRDWPKFGEGAPKELPAKKRRASASFMLQLLLVLLLLLWSVSDLFLSGSRVALYTCGHVGKSGGAAFPAPDERAGGKFTTSSGTNKQIHKNLYFFPCDFSKIN